MHLSNKFMSYLRGKYNLLMTLLLVLFIFRPFHNAEIYSGIWKFFLILALIVAIFDCHHRRWVQIITGILSVPSLVFSWLFIFDPSKPIEFGLGFSTILFLLISTISIIFDVVARARVTAETLRGVVCAYFLFAILFAYMYTIIEFLQPDSFQIQGKVVSTMTEVQFFSQMLYFSFTTLLTIGFGDISPIQDIGQTAVVIEGIIGQFYIAILVAKIVSVYAFSAGKHLK